MFRIATLHNFEHYLAYFLLDEIKRITFEDQDQMELRTIGKPVSPKNKTNWYCYIL